MCIFKETWDFLLFRLSILKFNTNIYATCTTQMSTGLQAQFFARWAIGAKAFKAGLLIWFDIVIKKLKCHNNKWLTVFFFWNSLHGNFIIMDIHRRITLFILFAKIVTLLSFLMPLPLLWRFLRNAMNIESGAQRKWYIDMQLGESHHKTSSIFLVIGLSSFLHYYTNRSVY